MKKTKKFLSLVLALVMLFSLTVTAGAAEEGKAMEGQIVILHTNDVHGAIGSYAKVAALKKAFQDAGAYVLLVDAGDYIQGDPTVSVSEGKTAVELMNMAGYDVAALGNHEFDYGYENLSNLAKDAKFPIVAANVLYNGKVAFKDNVTFTAPDGKKIGVFGLDTPETATKAHPAKIKGVTFQAGQQMFATAQAQVNTLKAAGCDYIVCLGHLGIDAESAGNRSIDLLEKVTGIDVFIDGHSHSTIDKVAEAAGETLETLPEQGTVVKGETSTISVAAGKTLITSTGTKLANIGAVILSKDGCSARNIPVEAITIDGDASVAVRAAAIQKQIDDDYGAVFAKTEVELDGNKDPGNRTQETNLGDLITDALVWGAKKNGETVDAAVTNGGGIRATIKAGNITKKDVNTVLPFGNTLSIVKVTGAELLEALEASTYCTPTAIGGFPQVSGIEFTVDTAKTFAEGPLYTGSTYHKPASINRVTIQKVGGKDFDLKATYAIATNDFMASGGDTYYAFSAASVNYDLGIPMDEVLMDYIKTELKGTVTTAAYGKPAGRITISAPKASFTDVAPNSNFAEAIDWAVEKGITNGTGDGTTFSPNTTCTNSHILTFLWRANGSPEPAGTVEMEGFTGTEYYYKAAMWAAEKDLIEGAFDPTQPCTRAMTVTYLWKLAGSPTDAKVSTFTDVASDAAYAQAINWAVEKGITKGNGDGTTFAPDNTCTRGQIATFLYRDLAK